MNHSKNTFSVYPGNPTATHLSMAAGGVRLLSWVVCIAAALTTLAALLAAFQILSLAGFRHGLYYLLDEMDEELILAFGLWCGFAVLRYAAAVLRAKITMLTQETSLSPQKP